MRQSLMRVIGGMDVPGAITATCFSSNFARLETLALAAIQSGRKVHFVLAAAACTHEHAAVPAGALHHDQL